MVNVPRVKGYWVAIAIFMLGVAAGGGSSYAYAQHQYTRLFRDRPDLLELRRLGALSHRLGLDERQRERVRSIMDHHGDARRELMGDLFQRCGDRLRAEEIQIDGEIRAVLDSDQQRRYDALAAERRGRVGFGMGRIPR